MVNNLKNIIELIDNNRNDYNDIVDMLGVICDLDICDEIRDFNEENGFMWTENVNVNKIGNLVTTSHSGASYACCMRNCQYYLKLYNEKNSNPDGSGEKIVGKNNYNNMDNANKKACDVMVKEGMDAAIKHLFTNEKTGEKLSYCEMRSKYG